MDLTKPSICAAVFFASGVAFKAYHIASTKCFDAAYLSRFISESSKTKRQEKADEFHSRVLAFTNCVVISVIIACFYLPDIIAYRSNIQAIFNLPLVSGQQLCHVILFGYIIHDTYWCIKYKWHSILNYTHHVFIVWYLWAVVSRNNTGYESCLGIFLAEGANCFYHFHWFYEFFRGKPTLANDVFFGIGFVTLRFAGGSVITYWLFTIAGDYPVRAACLVIDLLNVGFIVQMYKQFKQNRVASNRSRQEKILSKLKKNSPTARKLKHK